jgi:hypothetical protein
VRLRLPCAGAVVEWTSGGRAGDGGVLEFRWADGARFAVPPNRCVSVAGRPVGRPEPYAGAGPPAGPGGTADPGATAVRLVFRFQPGALAAHRPGHVAVSLYVLPDHVPLARQFVQRLVSAHGIRDVVWTEQAPPAAHPPRRGRPPVTGRPVIAPRAPSAEGGPEPRPAPVFGPPRADGPPRDVPGLCRVETERPCPEPELARVPEGGGQWVSAPVSGETEALFTWLARRLAGADF